MPKHYFWHRAAVSLTLFVAGIFFPMATTIAAPKAGSLLKGSGPAVYYLDEDGKRNVFLNEKVYASWYADFSAVKNVSDAMLAAYPLGGVVTYRPGTRLVKIATDPKVYAVAAGGVLRWVRTEALARVLYGEQWNKNIDDVSDAFFSSFESGDPITDVMQYSAQTERTAAANVGLDILVSARRKNRCRADSWSCGSWSACSASGTQTRSCTMTFDCPTVTTPSPATTQSCTPPPPACTADTWTCGDWSVCSASGSQTRSCTMTFDCATVTTPSPATTQSCTPPPPACTADTWSCGDWNACSSGGTQTRSCTMTFDCSNAVTPSPATSQSCTPPPPACTADTWTCGDWSACSASGTQTRSCTMTFDCATATTPSPATSQSCTPPPPTSAAVTFNVNMGGAKTAISPYIYGLNWSLDYTNRTDMLPVPFIRQGGNRRTTYNWELNVSNAGTDYNNNSDYFLSSADDQTRRTLPGEHVRLAVERGHQRNWATMLTVPIIDWLPADGNGPVTCSATGLRPGGTCTAQPSRWVANKPTKGSALSLSPNLTDGTVYQDEFINFIQTTFPDAQTHPAGPVMYSLDNEPGLWPETHPYAHPSTTTYAEMATRTVAAGRMIKSLAPTAMVFGPASYGWNEFITLQDAPDAGGRLFLDYYLQTLRNEEQANGKRVVDVLDVHWYPEAKSSTGTRITENSTSPSAAVVDARLQAPRSLWDSTYRETSWIANYVGGPIRLIPWLKERVAAGYPGTKLAITEYNYGGGSHISGGIAQADVLGVFGREGVYAATVWNLGGFDFLWGGMRMYLDYDGAGAKVGSLSVPSSTTDIAKTSVYAFADPADANALQVVLLNKTTGALDVALNIPGTGAYSTANVYRLTSANTRPQAAGTITVGANNAISTQLPAMSVTTLRLRR